MPVENSLMVANALTEHHIPFEMHIYPEGEHGLALSNWLTTSQPESGLPPRKPSRWIAECADWVLHLAGMAEICGLE